MSNNELWDYIDIAKNVGNHEFILKYKQKLGDFAVFIAEQSYLSTKAINKLPSFSSAKCIYTARSLEQCTSEAVAHYKASVIKGNTILTLAAGIGSDDFAFSKKFKQVVSIDNDENLNTIAIKNFNLLGITNIERITATAEATIQAKDKHFDAIYIDPDRRNDKERQILLSEHQPNVIQLLPQLLTVSDHIWIKCSPLYDIDMALKEIESIAEIYCISLKGEVKEMLLHVNKKPSESIKTTCVDIRPNKIIDTEFKGESIIPEIADEIKGFFFEAGSTLVKLRKHHAYAAGNQLSLIDLKVPFYCGNKENTDFLGKCLPIKNTFPFNARQIKLYLKTNKITQLNIKVRGANIDTKSLFKKLEINEGGEDFLFICPYKGKNTVIHCG